LTRGWREAPDEGHRPENVVKDWISVFADNAVIAIDAMAVLIIAIGTIEMFVTCIRSVFAPTRTGRDLRDGYLRYARWLMAGLTFQLANDIIISARAPTWDDIGRLAAIAFIRTFLNFFLERDIVEAGKFRMDAERSPPEPDVMPRR
jgi:uncharacterized membrane protein